LTLLDRRSLRLPRCLRSSYARQGTQQQKSDYDLQCADARAETHEIAPIEGYCAAQNSILLGISSSMSKFDVKFPTAI
jgi:hypothetical protein